LGLGARDRQLFRARARPNDDWPVLGELVLGLRTLGLDGIGGRPRRFDRRSTRPRGRDRLVVLLLEISCLSTNCL